MSESTWVLIIMIAVIAAVAGIIIWSMDEPLIRAHPEFAAKVATYGTGWIIMTRDGELRLAIAKDGKVYMAKLDGLPGQDKTARLEVK